MKGSVDIQKQMEEMQYISKHQPVESFTNRLSRVMQNSYAPEYIPSEFVEKLLKAASEYAINTIGKSK